MSANLATLNELPKQELVQKLARVKASVAAMRQHGQRVAKLGADSVLTVAGGAMAGVLSVKMPKIPGTQIDSDLGIGTAMVLLALCDVADGYDAELNALGSGMLAVAASREVTTHLLASKK